MRVSIITVVLNNRAHMEECIANICGQDHSEIEYIVIDGGSSDGTRDILDKHRDKIAIALSSKDSGAYEAMNKGIRLATGDVVGFLHSDDLYAHREVITGIVKIFKEHQPECVWGDLVYVSRTNPDTIVRYWKSSAFHPGMFQQGWMPPHPTLFVKNDVYKKYGGFNLDFKIAADYEFMLRLFEKYRIKTYYSPNIFVKMRLGGRSNRSILNMIRKSQEDYLAWKINRMPGGARTVLLKNLSKIPQFFQAPQRHGHDAI